jgi:hypothetical protein
MMSFDPDMRRDLYLHVHAVTLLRVLLRDGWPNNPPSSAWHAGTEQSWLATRGQPRRLSAAV